MNNKSSTPVTGFVIVIASIAALAGLLFGYDTGVISGALLFFRKTFALNATQIECVVSAVLAGAFLGSLTSGHLADRYGRRSLLLVIALLFAIGSLVSAYSTTVLILIGGRFILGLAIGVGSYVAPLYISEISPPEVRGALVSLNQLAVTLGIVLSYAIDYAFADKVNGWRYMLGLGVIPGIILFIGMMFLPRSPRWLVSRGKLEEAKKLLKKIRQKTRVTQEINAILESNQYESQRNWHLLLKKWVLPALLIGFGINIFQQITGINTIIYYAPTILKIAGFHQASTAILATVIVGTVNVLFTIFALPLLDRWGRRPLLIGGLICMTASLFYLGFAFGHQASHASLLKWLALLSMVAYIAGFAVSLGPIAWLLPAEIFPLAIRGLAMSVAVSCNWLFNFLVAMSFLTLIQTLHPSGTFTLFGALSVLALIFVYFFVPDTKGVSLEQIEENLKAGVPIRRLGEQP